MVPMGADEKTRIVRTLSDIDQLDGSDVRIVPGAPISIVVDTGGKLATPVGLWPAVP